MRVGTDEITASLFIDGEQACFRVMSNLDLAKHLLSCEYLVAEAQAQGEDRMETQLCQSSALIVAELVRRIARNLV